MPQAPHSVMQKIHSAITERSETPEFVLSFSASRDWLLKNMSTEQLRLEESYLNSTDYKQSIVMRLFHADIIARLSEMPQNEQAKNKGPWESLKQTLEEALHTLSENFFPDRETSSLENPYRSPACETIKADSTHTPALSVSRKLYREALQLACERGLSIIE